MGMLDYLTCLVRNMYASQEATVRPYVEQRISSKFGKEEVKAVYCHPAYLTCMQSTSCEMPGWMNHKLESRLLGGEKSTASDMQMTTPMAESEEELNSFLIKVKAESEKVGLKLNIQKRRSWHLVLSIHGK